MDTNAAQPASPEVDVDAAPDAVRDAEAAVAALADSFLVWIGEDFVLEHNLKGEGGEIGAQLTGKIAQLVTNIPAPA